MDNEELLSKKGELVNKFGGELPDYLLDLFDEAELKKILEEKKRPHLTKKEFFEKHKTELVKRTRRNPKIYAPVWEESPRATDRLKEEIDRDSTTAREICEIRLDAFAIRYFPHYLKKPNSEFHDFLYDLLTNNVGKNVKWAIAAPRSNAKSSLVSCIFPIWCLVYSKKRFIVLVSNTAGQAEDSLSDIKRELEQNEMLKMDFPYACGKGEVWRADEIITRNKVKMRSLGTGNQVRGRRFGTYRPDLVVCHEKGTQMLYNDKWVLIEEHPTAKSRIDNGLEVKIHGLPFTETVTTDHRYYVKNVIKKYNKSYDIGNNWLDAKYLGNSYNSRSYIGYKIDYSIEFPHSIPIKASRITKRNSKGQIVETKNYYKYRVPEEFYDKDFWWFVGLWWGDGYSSGKYTLNITFNNKEITNYFKFRKIAARYNRKVSITSIQKGCFQATVSWSYIARWLKSWRVGNSKKKPPYWVEKLNFESQIELVRGYIAADGYIDYENDQVRLTSVCLDELLSLRRILMRLNIPSSIRHSIEGTDNVYIEGDLCTTQKKYDLRFRDNAKLLGYKIENQSRYKYNRLFIEDGVLWSKVHNVKPVHNKIFIPIQTNTHTYTTHYGISHNCDDLEDSEMVRSETQRDKIRYEWFNKDLIYAGGEEDSPTDFFIVGTVLGKYSLLNALLTPAEYPDWSSKKFKAVYQFSDSPLWNEWTKIFKNPFDIDRKETAKRFFEDNKEEMLKGTSVLWPLGDPYYDLMVDQLRDPQGFLAEKQNEAIDPTAVLIPYDNLFWMEFDRPEIQETLKNSFYFGALDPSLGKKKNVGDNSAIVTLARDRKSGIVFVVDINSKRRTVAEQIDDIMKYHAKYKYHLFGVETNAFQFVVAESLRKKSREEGIYIPIKEVDQYQDKKMRVEGIVPFINDGTIVFDWNKYKTDPMYYRGVSEITSFTGSGDEQDDVPDSLSTAFEIAKKPRFKLLTKQTKG